MSEENMAIVQGEPSGGAPIGGFPGTEEFFLARRKRELIRYSVILFLCAAIATAGMIGVFYVDIKHGYTAIFSILFAVFPCAFAATAGILVGVYAAAKLCANAFSPRYVRAASHAVGKKGKLAAAITAAVIFIALLVTEIAGLYEKTDGRVLCLLISFGIECIIAAIALFAPRRRAAGAMKEVGG